MLRPTWTLMFSFTTWCVISLSHAIDLSNVIDVVKNNSDYSETPSRRPSTSPSLMPSPTPTKRPSANPSSLPTSSPSSSPTRRPTSSPTSFPSLDPSSSRVMLQGYGQALTATELKSQFKPLVQPWQPSPCPLSWEANVAPLSKVREDTLLRSVKSWRASAATTH